MKRLNTANKTLVTSNKHCRKFQLLGWVKQILLAGNKL